MKKLLSVLLLATCSFGITQAQIISHKQEVTGYWEGAYIGEEGIQILKMDVYEEGGRLFSDFEVPDMGWIWMRIPIAYDSGSDKVNFRFIHGDIELLADLEEAEMRGFATARNGDKLKVHMKRSLKPAETSFSREDITYMAGEDSIAASIFYPDTKGPHPIVIVAQGRSYGNRWGQAGTAIYLAKRGVATLLFDGRGAGRSTGNRPTLTEEDRYQDVLSAIEEVKKKDYIDASQIGLWGVSAGGWVVSEVASRSKDIDFMILDVGPSVSLADQQGHVPEYRMRLSNAGFPEEQIQAAFNYQKSLVELSWKGAEWSEFEPIIEEAKKQPWSQFVDLPENMENSELDYYRRRKYDPAPGLSETTIPVFAFYGGRDFAVPAQENAPELEKLLKQAGNNDYKILVQPEGNHGMRIPAGMRGEEGGEWPERYFRWPRSAPGTGELIYEWILEHVNLNEDR